MTTISDAVAAIRGVLPDALLLLAGLLVFAALLFLLVAAWCGRNFDTDGGEYRDAGKTTFGRFDEKQRLGLARRYP